MGELVCGLVHQPAPPQQQFCRNRAAVYSQAGQRHPRRWSGLIRQHRKSNTNPINLSELPEQQQGRHLYWQPPPRKPSKCSCLGSQRGVLTAVGQLLEA